MGLSKFVKNAIKVVGAVTKVSVEIGTEAIGSIAEKIDDNTQIKDKIVNYGKNLGQTIKKNSNSIAENSGNIVDKALDTGVNTYKNISEDIVIKINEATKKYQEKNNNKIGEDVYQYKVNLDYEKESKDIKQKDDGYIPKEICAKIVGVTVENRQSTVEKLKVGEIVVLIREPNNQYDKDAIAVYNESSEMLGYIPKDIESDLAKAMDEGTGYEASVRSKSGGNGFNYEATIQVTKVNLKASINNNCNEEVTRSFNTVSAQLTYATGDWEGTYQLLKNENKSRPKVLSMLGASCFYTARFEEAHKIFCKLFTGDDIYTHELGCSLNEYDAFGKDLYKRLEYMKIKEFNLPDKLNNDFTQSIERADEQYEELDEFREAVKLEKSEFKNYLDNVEIDTQSSDAQKRGRACFNSAEVYFRTGNFDKAFSYYVDAISSQPSKALYYGYNAQALMRTQNPEYVMALYSRRAVDLDPENARWHMLHGIVCGRLSKNYHEFFLNTARMELETALKCCRKDQISLKNAIEVSMRNFGIKNPCNSEIEKESKNTTVDASNYAVDIKAPKENTYTNKENNTKGDNMLMFETAKNSVILTAEECAGFLQFVSKIQEATLKFFLENQYQTLKNSNKYDSVHLGENGCFEFVGALLLFTYSVVANDRIAMNGCNEAILMAFKGAPAEIFSNVMDDVINEETNIEYEEWSAVYRYLKENYGTWIRKFEFSADYTMSDHRRYKKFIES